MSSLLCAVAMDARRCGEERGRKNGEGSDEAGPDRYVDRAKADGSLTESTDIKRDKK